MHSDVCNWIWFKLGVILENYGSLCFDLSLCDLDLILGPQEYEKAKTFVPARSQKSQRTLVEHSLLLRLNWCMFYSSYLVWS